MSSRQWRGRGISLGEICGVVCELALPPLIFNFWGAVRSWSVCIGCMALHAKLVRVVVRLIVRGRGDSA